MKAVGLEVVGLGAGGHGRGRWRSSCPSWLARWRGLAVMAPPRLSVRAGIRAVALRLPPCVRAGTRAVGDRSRSGRCRVRMPCARAARLAAAEFAGLFWAGDDPDR